VGRKETAGAGAKIQGRAFTSGRQRVESPAPCHWTAQRLGWLRLPQRLRRCGPPSPQHGRAPSDRLRQHPLEVLRASRTSVLANQPGRGRFRRAPQRHRSRRLPDVGLVLAPRLVGGRPPPARRSSRLVERQGSRPVPSTAHWRSPVVPWRARRLAPRLSRRAAWAVVASVAPEVGRTSLRAWGRNLRQWPRKKWGAAQAVPAIARRWMLRQARRAGRTTSRQAPSVPAKVVRGDRRAPCRKGRGRQGQPRGARWSPAVVVDTTATRIRPHRAGRAAVRTSAVPIVGGRAQGDSLVPHGRHNGDTIQQSVARESRRQAKCVADGSTTGALQKRISIRPCRFLA